MLFWGRGSTTPAAWSETVVHLLFLLEDTKEVGIKKELSEAQRIASHGQHGKTRSVGMAQSQKEREKNHPLPQQSDRPTERNETR